MSLYYLFQICRSSAFLADINKTNFGKRLCRLLHLSSLPCHTLILEKRVLFHGSTNLIILSTFRIVSFSILIWWSRFNAIFIFKKRLTQSHRNIIQLVRKYINQHGQIVSTCLIAFSTPNFHSQARIFKSILLKTTATLNRGRRYQKF